LQQRTIAPLRYEFPADHLISGLKYHGRLAHAPLLGELLLTRVQQAKLRRPDVLLPVPLHRKRLRERGYNQALELSRPLARHWQIQPETQLIERQRHTFAQMRLSAAARTKNPKGAFVLNTKRLAQLGTPQHVMIVDDVMTTGATLKAIAALLQQAGIPQITLCAVARTP
jgi:ComF family protein